MSSNNNKFRQFGLTNFAVDNGVSILVLVFIIILYGLRSYNNVPKELFPEVVIPNVFINTVYPGNSAADIENLITRPIESELSTVSGIKNVTSTSMQDFSIVVAEFETYVEPEEALRKVKDAVDKSKSELPTDLKEDPQVFDIAFSELPIMSVNISGEYSNDELRHYAELLQDEIENLSEISQVNIKGAMDREVKIDVDMHQMEALEVSFNDIENAIFAENLTVSSGEIVTNGVRRSLRVVGEIQNIEEIEKVIVKSEQQKPVFVRDIAKVSFGFADQTSIARSDGFPVIALDVVKRKGTNLISTSEKVKEVVEKVKTEFLPSKLKVSFFNDQSLETINLVNNLENSIISGMILVTLILLFFLGMRNAVFVGIAIPLSMLMGMAALSLMGISLNMVSLFGLILALGMLVDNGIVIVENIYRFLQNKFSKKESAKYGAGEVAVPIITSTLTTLVAFLPLAFWPGLMGTFMKYLPISLIAVMLSSLLVALVINPVFASYFIKEEEIAQENSASARKKKNFFVFIGAVLVFALIMHFGGESLEWLRNSLLIVAFVSIFNKYALNPMVLLFQKHLLPWINRIYEKSLKYSIKGKMPRWVFLWTVVLFILSFALLGIRIPKIEFFPMSDPMYVNAFIELPIGTDIKTTDQTVKQIEEKISTAIKGDMDIVEAVLTQIGEGTADPNGPPDPGASPHKARVTVSFIPEEQRNGKSSTDVLNKMRDAVKDMVDAKIVVAPNENGPPTGKAINIEVEGDDIDQLAILSQDIINFLNKAAVPGVEELQSDMQIGKPEYIIQVDREAANRYGVSTWNVADVIRTAIYGREISKYKVGEDEYPMMLRVSEEYRNKVEAVLGQKVTFRSMSTGQISQVPLASLVTKTYTTSYNAVKRKNQKRVITVFSNVLGGYNANEVIVQLKDQLKQFPMPNNFKYKFTGEQQEQAEAMAFLGNAFLLAMLGIFFILVLQFNSIVAPFIIISSVVFSTIGVFLGYFTTGADISLVMTGVGVISLAGIVVNNAIVLVDYTNLVVARKKSELGIEDAGKIPPDVIRDALLEAGSTRLRPVLLTAITTVLGLIPLALGFNFNFFTLVSDLDPQLYFGGQNASFWGPMAWTVIYGLVFSTLLTLIIVPAMYYLAFRIKYKVVDRFR
ncbi:MAG TPA: copper transporter [Saprospirales bacterium]|nr:copper transporter [Saprospirales bacterium]HRQ28702.1 efflux RND transporter permease subunit [Saprospiraceae bacterium]